MDMSTHIHPDDVKTLLDTGASLGEPKELTDDGLYVVVVPAGQHVEVIDPMGPQFDNRLTVPRRPKGTVVVRDAKSFTDYWDKHSLPETDIFGDLEAPSVLAIFNANQGVGEDVEGDAGWSDHRVKLEVKRTKSWLAWTAHNGQLMEQDDFAEHIEARLIDIVEPTGAEMLELAQSVQASISGEFESGSRLDNGQRRLVYRETIDAKAGERGELIIPPSFELGIEPFEGSEAVRVTARFRFRIISGHLRLGYVLERPEDVEAEAFTSILETIEGHIGRRVLRGKPAT